ncbi:hypothetical protein AMK58_28360 (plasmid) [Azospirillum brasilense]|nr:hypothetical protein AMK58_28360 [Azospirillum brasilense]
MRRCASGPGSSALRSPPGQRFLAIHDPIANLFHLRRDHRPVADYRKARAQAFQVWAEAAGAPLAA